MIMHPLFHGIQEVSGSIPLISTRSPEIERFQDFFFLFSNEIPNLGAFFKRPFFRVPPLQQPRWNLTWIISLPCFTLRKPGLCFIFWLLYDIWRHTSRTQSRSALRRKCFSHKYWYLTFAGWWALTYYHYSDSATISKQRTKSTKRSHGVQKHSL